MLRKSSESIENAQAYVLFVLKQLSALKSHIEK